MYSKYLLTTVIVALLLMISLTVTPAIAGPSVDESRSMDADGEISLNMVEGELQVSGWDRDSFEVTGELGSDEHELVISGDEDDWAIEVRLEKRWGKRWSFKNKDETDLVLHVPHAAAVNLSAVSADMIVTGLDGDALSIESVSGDLDIEVAADHIDLETVSGDVDINGSNTSVEMETVSGDIVAKGISGEAEAESVSGDIRISASDLENLYAGTVSGDVKINTSLSSNARVELETHSGEIDLFLPANTRFDFDSDTFSGDVSNEFGSDSNSDIDIEAETFSGNIRIKKQ